MCYQRSMGKTMTLKSASEVKEIKKAELKVENVMDTETILAELAIKNQVNTSWGDMMMSDEEDEEIEEVEEEELDFMGRPMTDNSAW